MNFGIASLEKILSRETIFRETPEPRSGIGCMLGVDVWLAVQRHEARSPSSLRSMVWARIQVGLYGGDVEEKFG
jgi:hypothetical protein